MKLLFPGGTGGWKNMNTVYSRQGSGSSACYCGCLTIPPCLCFSLDARVNIKLFLANVWHRGLACVKKHSRATTTTPAASQGPGYMRKCYCKYSIWALRIWYFTVKSEQNLYSTRGSLTSPPFVVIFVRQENKEGRKQEATVLPLRASDCWVIWVM